MERTSAALSACLHPSRLTSHADLLASLTGNEWTAVIAMATRHGIASHLLGVSELAAPAEVMARLHERAVVVAQRTLHYRTEFLSLAAELAPEGVQIMALKGIHLALAVYPPSVTREMADIDILVRPGDVDAVAAAARRLGYRDDPNALARVAHHVPTMRKPGVMLEVHWRLAGEGAPPVAEPADLWARARPLGAGGNTWALPPEDSLVHVCAHAAYSHYFEHGIRPLCDIQALAARTILDWEAVVTRAHAWDCARGVAMGLVLARDVLGVQVPAAPLERLGGEPPPDVVAATLGQVFGQRTAIRKVSAAAGQLLTHQTLSSRLAHALLALRLPPSQVAALYPHRRRGSFAAVALATVRRAADLVRRYGWTLLRLAVRRESPEHAHVLRRNHLLAWLRQP